MDDHPVPPTTVADLVRRLVAAVERHYGPADRVEALGAALAGYADDRHPVDPHRLRTLEAAGKTVFRHLDLRLSSGPPAERSPGWPPVDPAAVLRAGAGLVSVRRATDGSAVIRLDELAPLPAAADVLAGVFAVARGASRVVLDLRRNGGGDPATLAYLVGWLTGPEPRHLFDVRYRDHVRQWWTSGVVPAAPPTAPVHVLIGPGTYSSAEALAWVLQRDGLGRLLGGPTRGAADHVLPLQVTHDVHALVPEGTVVAPDGGPSWEGAGVQPDEVADLPAD